MVWVLNGRYFVPNVLARGQNAPPASADEMIGQAIHGNIDQGSWQRGRERADRRPWGPSPRALTNATPDARHAKRLSWRPNRSRQPPTQMESRLPIRASDSAAASVTPISKSI